MFGLAHAQRYHDAWQNCLTGLGVIGLDRSQGNSYAAPCHEINPQELTNIFRTNWLSRRVVQSLPERALARGFGEKMPEQFDALNYAQWDEGALQRALDMGRLFGGAHLFVGYADGGDPKTPVTRKGNVAFLDVFTRHQLVPAQVNGQEARDLNPLSPTAGQVTVWKVAGDHIRQGLEYHVSRAIKFGGNSAPPLAVQGYSVPFQQSTAALYYRDWSDSVLLPVWEEVQRYGIFWQNITHLLGVSSVGVLKLGGLIEALAHNGGEAMRARVDILNQALALTRNLLLDSSQNEDYDRKSVSFADVPQLLDQMMISTAAALQMPATELFGRAPQGMNATGEGDRLQWYARVGEWRERVLQPRVNALAEAISGQATDIEFPAIHQPSEAELADLRFKLLSGDDKLFGMNAASAEDIRRARHEGKNPEDLSPIAPEPPPAPEVIVGDPSAPPGNPFA